MQDQRSTSQLIAAAHNAQDEDEYWQIVATLHLRGTADVFDVAQVLCQSENNDDRLLRIDILGQLGTPNFPFREPTVEILLGLLQQASTPESLRAIGVALGHIGSKDAIAPLSRLKDHPHEDVRFGVTYGLMTQEDPLAIATLIQLSADPVGEIRNWATFALGQQIDIDTPEIRRALWARVEAEKPGIADPEVDEIYGEALVGLALRGDTGIIKLLLEELYSGSVSTLTLEACEELGDERLYPGLLAVQVWCKGDTYRLDFAIAACKPKN